MSVSLKETMQTQSFRKRILAGLSSIALIGGLVVASSSSPVLAATGPFYPLVEAEVEVDNVNKSFDILAGQTIKVTIST